MESLSLNYNDEILANQELAIKGETIFKIDPLNSEPMIPGVTNVKPVLKKTLKL